jgi:hypothetical protein
MKLQAHLPTVSVSARDWRAATVALVSLFGASMLLLAIQFGGLLNNPLVDRLRMLPVAHPDISGAHRVSLDLHFLSNPINPSRRFSVAHPLPADVTWPQRFSIGSDARLAFEGFGEAAHRDMRSNEKPVRQFQPHSDRMLLMLMLLRLHPHRS